MIIDYYCVMLLYIFFFLKEIERKVKRRKNTREFGGEMFHHNSIVLHLITNTISIS